MAKVGFNRGAKRAATTTFPRRIGSIAARMKERVGEKIEEEIWKVFHRVAPFFPRVGITSGWFLKLCLLLRL